jgi:hypothetical protein
MGNNPYYPPMPNPFFSFPPYYPPPPQHAFPPFPLPPYPEPTIKMLLNEFLQHSQAHALDNKMELREILYKLIIFIDQNQAAIGDPRVKDTVLLSYCDIFSPKFIGPLLNEYILQRATLITEKETPNSAIVAEVDYLKQLMGFLRERKLVKSDSVSKNDSSLAHWGNSSEATYNLP